MSQVWSCNEWDPLEEVIVGNPLGARFPHADPSTRLAEYPDRDLAAIPQGPFPDQIIEETEEDLQGLPVQHRADASVPQLDQIVRLVAELLQRRMHLP